MARALLSDGDIAEEEAAVDRGFGWAFALAVLHHLPTREILQSTVKGMRELMQAGSRSAVSVWDFLASPRFQDRILPWDTVGLSSSDVDEGDYLLDWREGGSGVRYVHHFDPQGLRGLAESGGFDVIEEFSSDGENGRLGLYQIWEAA